MIDVSCGCGWKAQIPDKYGGKNGLCPHCKSKIPIPHQDNLFFKYKCVDWLGYISLFYGVFSSSICWIPIAKYPIILVSSIGILSGVGSIVAHNFRKRNIELPISGIIINALAIIGVLIAMEIAKSQVNAAMESFQESLNQFNN